jgi:arsenate reductase-like glutaredoxin family protein
MNIQIFGKNKCFASRSAERFFKERKIKYQFINLEEKGLSSREIDNVLASIKNIDFVI